MSRVGIWWTFNLLRDIGVLDENGYGRIVGRIKDMVIRGGENIYPREIEELLHTHPSVQEAQVLTGNIPNVLYSKL